MCLQYIFERVDKRAKVQVVVWETALINAALILFLKSVFRICLLYKPNLSTCTFCWRGVNLIQYQCTLNNYRPISVKHHSKKLLVLQKKKNVLSKLLNTFFQTFYFDVKIWRYKFTLTLYLFFVRFCVHQV